MRIVRLAVLLVFVLASFALMLYAGGRTFTIFHFRDLEAGKAGVVRRMIAGGMAASLEAYHLREVGAAGVKLPPAAPYAPAPSHPDAERFFYVDAHGNITIEGISDKNIPRDHLSQKCLLFCDRRLPWFKARLLFEAFLTERISYVYLAGLTNDGKLSYVQLEICEPGEFRIYPYMICMLNDREAFYYNENEDTTQGIDYTPGAEGRQSAQEATKNLESFKIAANSIHDDSPIENPFVRLLAGDSVSAGAVYERLAMFLPAGIQPISIISRVDARPQILEEVAEFARKQREGGKK
jgi:hypothetical protein